MKAKFFMAVSLSLLLGACGNTSKQTETAQVDDAAFYETQPMHSGQYRAVAYDIKGEKARSGKFDGRLLIYLSPEQSGAYVYENGNRAKIDYKIALARPFEKGDSGIYKTVDSSERPVSVKQDSTLYILTFERNGAPVTIEIESDAMQTGTALEILERTANAIQKNQ